MKTARSPASASAAPMAKSRQSDADTLILACNGFGGNREMVAQFIPEMADAEYYGHNSNTGDAVDWGIALGAAMADMGSYQGHGSVAYPHGLPLTWAVMTQGGFQVNLDGYRFADEMRGYSEHAQEVIKQPGHLAWNIYDERCEKPALGFHDYREIVKLGAVKRANTIDELASLIDLPSKTLSNVRGCCADTPRERSRFVDRVCALDRAQLDDLAIIVKPECGLFAPLVVNVPSKMTGLFDDLLRVF